MTAPQLLLRTATPGGKYHLRSLWDVTNKPLGNSYPSAGFSFWIPKITKGNERNSPARVRCYANTCYEDTKPWLWFIFWTWLPTKISISSTKPCLQEQQYYSWKVGILLWSQQIYWLGRQSSNLKWVSVGITSLITKVKGTLIVGNNSRNPVSNVKKFCIKLKRWIILELEQINRYWQRDK